MIVNRLFIWTIWNNYTKNILNNDKNVVYAGGDIEEGTEWGYEGDKKESKKRRIVGQYGGREIGGRVRMEMDSNFGKNKPCLLFFSLRTSKDLSCLHCFLIFYQILKPRCSLK